jgi:hypothetical protein
MNLRQRIARVVMGLLVIAVVAVAGFAYVSYLIPTWGADPDEVERTLPGDELIATPLVDWTHAITIDAPADHVWQWIAQIGERRGAFYSYTFIENRMGNGDVYHNADRIVPEWQNPQAGIILVAGEQPLKVQRVEPGKSMVAFMSGDFKWLWGWHLQALDAQHTRLLVRMKIQIEGMDNPIVGAFMNFGGFMMAQNMMQGIKQRAEGSIPPAYSETLELAVWLFALFAGILAAILFLLFKDWILPLAIGIAAVAALLVFTFWQPAVWLRVVADVLMWGGLAWFVVTQYNARLLHKARTKRPGSLSLKPAGS